MKLSNENLEILAAKAYTNSSCMSTEEFLEDLSRRFLIKRLAKKISSGNSKNLRLLTNHIICFTNNFDIQFSKDILLFETSPQESRVLRAVFLYLGFLTKNEYTVSSLDFETLKLLKDMD